MRRPANNYSQISLNSPVCNEKGYKTQDFTQTLLKIARTLLFMGIFWLTMIAGTCTPFCDFSALPQGALFKC